MNLSHSLQTMARQLPDSPAISWDGGRLNYGQFEDQVARIAGALVQRHGLRNGDRVAMAMANCGEFLPVLYGIWRAGLAAIPINNKLHGREIQWIVDNAGAKLIIASPKLADVLTSLGVPLPPIIATGTSDFKRLLGDARIDQSPTEPTDEAWIFYTSGTTGRPKGAILTHRNLLFACHAYYTDIDFLDDRDTCLHAAPLSHGAGLYALPHIARGSHQVVMDGFEPEQIIKAFATRQNVSMFAAPTMVTRLVHHTAATGGDTSGLKTIIYGGAPMYVADLKTAIATFGPKFYQLYGQGEAPMTITGLTKRLHGDTLNPKYEERLASAGIARVGCAYRIVDERGNELPVGDVGEIISKSDCVMKGYWNNPEANARALRDGWLWTGDLGSRDADGFLTLKDRSKDMIISGGSNIYPREIEDVLLTDARVLECAVVSRPHADWGEEVIAYIVAKPGSALLDVHALDQLCLANIARFKRPKGYRFVDALPKNNYGKILKTELRERLKSEAK
jgi:long-chain acyl-CoA synthetase